MSQPPMPGSSSGLRNLGATIFGKTVSTEFAWRHPGPTVNPWNADAHAGRIVVGLGGGGRGRPRAAGARHANARLGNPAGGIQRHRRIQAELSARSRALGVHPLSPSLDHVGFFARRVDDVALALSLLAGLERQRSARPARCPAFRVDIEHGRRATGQAAACRGRASRNGRASRPSTAAGIRGRDRKTARRRRRRWTSLNCPSSTTSMGARSTPSSPAKARLIFADLVARYPDRTSDHLKSLVGSGKSRSRDRLSCGQGVPGANGARRSSAEIKGYDAHPDAAGLRRSAARPALHWRRRILRALDPARRARGDAAGRLRQKRSRRSACRSSAATGRIFTCFEWRNGSKPRSASIPAFQTSAGTRRPATRR